MARTNLPTILFLAEAFPFDLAGGAQQRWASLILTLTATARVHLVCFQTQPKSRQETDAELEQFITKLPEKLKQRFQERFGYDCILEPNIALPPGKRLGEWLKSFITHQPFLAWQYQSSAFQNKINDRIANLKPKVIHLGHLRLALFLPQSWLNPNINKKTRPRLVYEAQNVEWQLVKTQADYLPKLGRWHWWWQREVSLTKHFETNVLRGVDQVITLSEPDATELKRLVKSVQKSSSNITVLPIFYPPIPSQSPPTLAFANTKQKNPQLIFVGNLDWLPNADAMRWFLTKIWPAFSEQFPTATLTIIGKPCSYLSLAPSVAANRVRFLGFVDDVQKYITPETICILPFRMGSGVRLKALEAAWNGATIVSTPLGVQGLNMTTEKHFLVGETESHFIHQLARIAYDQKLKQNLSAAAQNYVLKQHAHELPKKFWRRYWGKTGLISKTTARVKTV